MSRDASPKLSGKSRQCSLSSEEGQLHLLAALQARVPDSGAWIAGITVCMVACRADRGGHAGAGGLCGGVGQEALECFTANFSCR